MDIQSLDKENHQQQIFGRKAGVLESSAPRTPFSAVNRQQCVLKDGADIVKPGQTATKGASGQSSSCTPLAFLRRQTKVLHLAPIESQVKKEAQKKRGDATDHEKETTRSSLNDEHVPLFYSLPVSPIIKLAPLETVDGLSPGVSQSCPEILSSDLSLPSICETPPHSPVVSEVSCSPSSLSGERSPSSPDIGLQMTCEEGTPPTGFNSSGSESDVLSFEKEQSEFNCLDSTDFSASVLSSNSLLSNESVGTEAEIALSEEAAQPESVSIVQSILEELLSFTKDTKGPLVSDRNIASNNSTNCGSVTFMAEYAKYLESHGQACSPNLPCKTSSLTDVTPCSQQSDVEDSRNSGCGASDGHPQVVMDCMDSFLSNSDCGSSDSITVRQHLTFEDRDLKSPEPNLDDSTGFVRSSESRINLTEENLEETPLSKTDIDKDDSVELDFLNLSISDQKVEFFSLPSKLFSVTSSPIIIQDSDSRDSASMLNKGMKDEVSSPVSAQTQNGQTAVGDHTSTPAIVPVTCTKSVALSPIPRTSVCDKDVNTSATKTCDADTMIRVLTAEVGLSPVPTAVRETSCMTSPAHTAETGMATEQAVCVDHSMLAVAEVDSKTTMTDHQCGHRTVSTTMTPFKVFAKQGSRLTSTIIRQQHPRTLANQLETLTMANSRLESEARSARQEHKDLQAILKEAKQALSSKEAALDAVEKQKEEDIKEREHRQEEKCQYWEQLSEARQTRITGLELELASVRSASEATVQKQADNMLALQEKCQSLEEELERVSQLYEQEIQEMKSSQEKNSYHHQFEHAQQMVRERDAELAELRALFTDLQTTADKQERVHSAYQEIHGRILVLAKENHALRDTVAERAEVSKDEWKQQQAEKECLKQRNAALTGELTTLKNTLAMVNGNMTELEKLYSTSSADLLTATGNIVELNSELLNTRKVALDATMSKETSEIKVRELECQLSTMQSRQESLLQDLRNATVQIVEEQERNENQKTVTMKLINECQEKFDHMKVETERMKEALASREVDIENLEEDLCQSRSIVVEFRQVIEELQSELKEAVDEVARKQKEEDDIEFYKNSNTILEAERALYVHSIRELEEKLAASTEECSSHQQAAMDADQFVEELQEDKLRLISELSHMQTEYLSVSRDLELMKENQRRTEATTMAVGKDLLKQMQTTLAELKNRTGLQGDPEPCSATAPLDQPPPSTKSSKRKRHSRKSFVSSILGAVEKSEPENRTDEDLEHVETGSYLGDGMTGSASNAGAGPVWQGINSQNVTRRHHVHSKSVRNIKESRASVSFRLPSPRQSGEPYPDLAKPNSSSQPSNSRRSCPPLSESLKETLGSRLGMSDSMHTTSSSLPARPVHSLTFPPSSQPPVTATTTAHNRARSLDSLSVQRSPDVSKEIGKGCDDDIGLEACVLSLQEVFQTICRLNSILDRAAQLSLQDLRAENEMLQERTGILEERAERNGAEVDISRKEAMEKDSTIAGLQQQIREMTEQMMTFTDQRFELKRLVGEVKRLETKVQSECSEKEIVSKELNSLLQQLETSASSAHGGPTQARCLRDIIALKKKNQQLLNQLEEQKDSFDERSAKAARRMRVLDENWKKAEDELYRLDQLVENIRQTAMQSRSSSGSSSLRHILHLIEGDSSPSIP